MATRKIHFFTGKGGVGKSTLAAAFAQKQAQQSTQKILLTELTERSFYKHFFTGPSGENGENSLKFDLAQWSPDICLREYALHLLKIESLYKLFFQNPVSKSLIQVAPGLQELAILGKATSGPRRHGPPTLHDEVVIDAFASGHFLNLLRAPKAMSEIISFGPMADQSKSIDQWIRNPDFTHIHVVTTAENYSVTETLELAESIQKEFNLKPLLYLNRLSGLTKMISGEGEAIDIFNRTIKNEDAARQLILSAGYHLVEVPLDVSENNMSLILSLSKKNV